MTKPILVTGGTGTLGRAVVRSLLDAGATVRVLSRRPATGREPYEWAVGDLREGEGIDAAVAGTGTIVHCASQPQGKSDVEATRNLTEAAKKAGTGHLVYISIVGIEKIPFFYYRAKLGAERVIEESGVPWTILRATQFHDLVAAIPAAQRWLPVTFTLDASCQPIAAGEVAERLAGLATSAPAGRVPDMGGPEVRSLRDLTRAWQTAAGRTRPVVPIRLPGAAFRGLRAGGNLTPENAVGKQTFDEFLRAKFG